MASNWRPVARSTLRWISLGTVLAVLAWLGLREDRTAFIGSLFAAGVSVAGVLAAAAVMRPSVRAEIEPEPPPRQDGRRFLRVRVWNQAMPWPWNIFLDRQPALFTKAWITFLTERNEPVFTPGHRMTGRWARTPEPVTPAVIPGPVTDQLRVVLITDPTRTTDSMDIAAGTFEVLDVVMRAPEEESCMGWHNAIIQNPEPQADQVFRLGSNRYHALVTVQTGGRRVDYVVRIVNDVPLEHFRLEPVRPQPALDPNL